MTLEERSLFWQALLQAQNMHDRELVEKTIHYPTHIFRYREIDTKSLSALQENKLYFSTSNYYDDPTDTYLHMKNIMAEMEQAATGLSHGAYGNNPYESALSIFGVAIGDLSGVPADVLLAEVRRQINALRNDIRKKSYSVCFSENGANPTMWIKYAKQHKGFALAYDLFQPDRFQSGPFDALPLYPMHYSQKKYDASRYALHLIIDMLYQQGGLTTERDKHRADYPCTWEPERVALIKHLSHQYDEEWRIVVPLTDPLPQNHIIWVPSSVILGMNMPEYERKIVASLALNAGVAKIQQAIINDDCDIDIEDATELYKMKM